MGDGNHRGSIFRLIVGTALAGKEKGTLVSTWGQGNTADRATLQREQDHERRVSTVIRAMPFLWLAIDDEPGPNSLRGLIERNSIALLSNYLGRFLILRIDLVEAGNLPGCLGDGLEPVAFRLLDNRRGLAPCLGNDPIGIGLASLRKRF